MSQPSEICVTNRHTGRTEFIGLSARVGDLIIRNEINWCWCTIVDSEHVFTCWEENKMKTDFQKTDLNYVYKNCTRSSARNQKTQVPKILYTK